MSFKEKIDLNKIPRHIAIIMDGNGRWAKQRGEERYKGHQAGAQTVQGVIEGAMQVGVRYLTLYTFSIENWSRPEEEVHALMQLFAEQLDEPTFIKNNIRFNVIGNIKKLPDTLQCNLQSCIQHTQENTALVLTLALSYSSKWEITKAVKEIAQEIKIGKMSIEDIDEKCVSDHLETNTLPDPDLLIRTGGEIRLSNYLLWQLAYSELYFCTTYWPDFNKEELYKAIYEYQNRERRFGKTSEQLS